MPKVLSLYSPLPFWEPGELASGLILFPREAVPPQALRLQLQGQNTGQVYTLNLPL